LEVGQEAEGAMSGVAMSLNIFVLVFQLRWLEHAGNPHSSVSFCQRLLLLFGLLLFQEEFRVIPRELLQLDQEVSERQLEPIDVVMIFTEASDEHLYLIAAKQINTPEFGNRRNKTYFCT
jgi:hypothetical protein